MDAATALPRRDATLSATPATIALLTALGAIGQFATNIYLPSFPAIVRDLATAMPAVQLTLTAFLATMALTQLVYGPLADRYGRRRTLLTGLALYLVGSVICTLAPDVGTLTAGRIVQAGGAGAGVVVSRAIVRDCFEGAEIGRVMATMAIGFSLVPAVVPFLGGTIQAQAGWRWSFALATLLGVAITAIVVFRLPETNRSHVERLHLGRIALAYLPVLRHAQAMGFAVAGMGAMGGLFAFYAGSPAVFIERLGISPAGYGFYPPISVAGFVIGGIAARRFARDMPEARLVTVGLLLLLAGALAMLLPPLLGFLHRFALTGAMVVFVAGLGIVMPISMAAGLRAFPERAGTAAALLGFLQMAAGAAGAALVSLLKHDLDILAFPTAMTAFAALALLGFLALGGGRVESSP